MNDTFISFDETKKELEEIERLGIDLTRSLSLLAQKIKYIIPKIKDCETLSSAREYFKLLDEIHSTLCKLVFREEVGISNRLRRFVGDFDNLEGNLEYIFGQIKDGAYTF